MTDGDLGPRDQASHALGSRLDGVHPVVYEEDLAAAVQLAVDGVPHQAVVVLRDAGLDRQPCLRRGLDDRQIADAHQAEVQGARNRRGRKGQHVDLLAERLDALLVRHPEALLLVDHQQAQVGERNVLRQDPMRPDQHVDRPVGNARTISLLLPLRHEAAEHGHLHRKGAEPPLEGAQVLLRQDGGRHQDRHLLAVLDGLEGGAQRHLGLAIADVAADQPIHRAAAQHVALHLLDGPRLVRRLGVRERLLQLPLPDAVRREAETGRRLPGGVDLQQIFRQLGNCPADPSLGALPVGAAQLAEGGSGAARVAADAADLVRRQEDLVLAREVELQILLDVAAVLALRHAGVAGDAVVDVDHQIARLQLADQIAGDDPLGRSQAPNASRAEQLAIGQDHQPHRLVDEPAGERAMDQPDGAGRRGLPQLRAAEAGCPASSSSSPMRLAWSVLITTRAAAHVAHPGAKPIEPARQHGSDDVPHVAAAGIRE